MMDTPAVGANGASAPAAAAAPPTADVTAPAPQVLTTIPLDAPADAPPVVAVGDEANRELKGGGGFGSGLCAGLFACCCLDMCF